MQGAPPEQMRKSRKHAEIGCTDWFVYGIYDILWSYTRAIGIFLNVCDPELAKWCADKEAWLAHTHTLREKTVHFLNENHTYFSTMCTFARPHMRNLAEFNMCKYTPAELKHEHSQAFHGEGMAYASYALGPSHASIPTQLRDQFALHTLSTIEARSDAPLPIIFHRMPLFKYPCNKAIQKSLRSYWDALSALTSETGIDTSAQRNSEDMPRHAHTLMSCLRALRATVQSAIGRGKRQRTVDLWVTIHKCLSHEVVVPATERHNCR